MTIGNRIKERRLTLKLTQETVALSVNVTKQTIQKYENSIITNIPSDKIELLANVLRCTPGYLMGWEDTEKNKKHIISENLILFPVIGDLSAGYEHIAIEEWDGDTIAIPDIYVKGDKDDYIVLRIIGNSMYPFYLEGDYVLIRKQDTVESGQIAAIIYDNDYATIKRVEFGKNSIMLIPFNPEYQPRTIQGEELNHCRIIGIPKLLIREIQ